MQQVYVIIIDMLQRIFVHLSLVLLFAFTQMGVVTHEISHFNNSEQQQNQPSQPDKNTAHSQCEKCISYSTIGGAVAASPFSVALTVAQHVIVISTPTSFQSTSTLAFRARAPPSSSQA